MLFGMPGFVSGVSGLLVSVCCHLCVHRNERKGTSGQLTDACSSSLFLESPLFFLGSFSFLDMDPEVLFLKGSLPPPEPLPYFVEGMLLCKSRWSRLSNCVSSVVIVFQKWQLCLKCGSP